MSRYQRNSIQFNLNHLFQVQREQSHSEAGPIDID